MIMIVKVQYVMKQMNKIMQKYTVMQIFLKNIVKDNTII